MRTIAHISDLHFGKIQREAEEALLHDLESVKPSLIAVSGDLTQGAMRRQFHRARQYLNRLPAPYIAVPGNHDIPFFDVARRLLLPLHRYRYYVHHDVQPMYEDEEISVLGMNTARSFVIESGKISKRQLRMAAKKFHRTPASCVKVIVTHHPFIRPGLISKYRRIVKGAEEALSAFEQCGVVLVLSGHFHRPFIGDLKENFTLMNKSMIHVQAGTAISTKLREQKNSYNVIRIAKRRIDIDVREWNGKKFVVCETKRYAFRKGGWHVMRKVK